MSALPERIRVAGGIAYRMASPAARMMDLYMVVQLPVVTIAKILDSAAVAHTTDRHINLYTR